MDFKAFISGCAGTVLTDDERALFAEARPCGLILFGRNCQSVAQLRALARDFRDAVESDEALVLID
ncbi:MAG TPA: beta-hexosaminidase, partial [Methyloceanibacter sp.]|nr:beta-hexosaminidase [Methyloceanibacter sp.]